MHRPKIDDDRYGRTVHVLLGTRAQLVKMAPVLREIEKRGIGLNLIFTGQHTETMDKLLAEFSVRATPRVVVQDSEASGILRMIIWVTLCFWRLCIRRREWFLNHPKNAILIVHGDTLSALLGAIVGRINGMRVAHTEAGLRSSSLFNPFPEEITRRLIGTWADIAFAPGAYAVENLAGRRNLLVVNTQQNTLLDTVRQALSSSVQNSIELPTTRYFVTSIHRFENLYLKTRLNVILQIVASLSEKMVCVFVLHPVTRKRLANTRWLEKLEASEQIVLTPRMGYFDFLQLISHASFVLTDGGSNQEELSYLNVPAVLMRNHTERQEGLDSNVCLSDYDEKKIRRFLGRQTSRQQTPLIADQAIQPSRLLVDQLEKLL